VLVHGTTGAHWSFNFLVPALVITSPSSRSTAVAAARAAIVTTPELVAEEVARFLRE
jgi:hypothetical protein